MHDGHDSRWDSRESSVPQAPTGLRSTLQSDPSAAPPGLRSTLPPQSAPQVRQTYQPAPSYGQQPALEQTTHAQPAANSWQDGGYGHHEAVQHSALQHGALQQHGAVDLEKRSQGVKNIVGGGVLIGIGFAFGGSVFLGNPDALDWFFDGLGSFWVLKGLYDVFTA